MAEILGLGMTHYPGLYRHESDMTATLHRTLAGKRTPAHLKDPANWPAPMREELGNDNGAAAARAHRERCFAATRIVRQRLDAFRPDLVVIFGDEHGPVDDGHRASRQEAAVHELVRNHVIGQHRGFHHRAIGGTHIQSR